MTLNSHTQFPHCIPQLVIWRATLSSLTDSLVILIDSSIISHNLLRNRCWPNQTFRVSFASKCMVLQLAICTSVKRAPMLSKVLLKYLLGSKKFNTSWPIFNNLPATCITMHYNGVHSCIVVNPLWAMDGVPPS